MPRWKTILVHGRGALSCLLLLLSTPAARAEPPTRWVTVWAASAQGAYPDGTTRAEPDLSAVFLSPSQGAHDQSFRQIIRPDLWGHMVRLHLTNRFGTRPVSFDDVSIGLQAGGAALAPRTNRPVNFQGKRHVTLAPGAETWSDPVTLGFVSYAQDPKMQGHHLAISFHVVGDSGPMTWHALAMATSYVGAPGGGSHAEADGEAGFPHTITSWFFIDALDVMAPTSTQVLVVFGDGLVDGIGATLNADDRWVDMLSRRLHAAAADRVVVVNAGIAGNHVLEDAAGGSDGPAAQDRVAHDVLGLDGVRSVLVLEGNNDLGAAGAMPEAVAAGFSAIARQLRAGLPGVRLIGGTLPPVLGSTPPERGSDQAEQRRRALNQFVRMTQDFDAMIDIQAAVMDPLTYRMRPEFRARGALCGAGCGLADARHFNHAGALAVADGIDLRLLVAPEIAAKK